MEETLKEKVDNALEKIRPYLRADGGDVELVDVSDDGIVQVKLTGACGSCPYSIMTLKNGIEQSLKSEIPEIKEVKSV
ncbi:MAG: NifU family protein [Marinilabiliales bacterium]